jgi:hypothetical protein
MSKKVVGISWQDVTIAIAEVKKRGYSPSMCGYAEIKPLDSPVMRTKEIPKDYGKNFNPSKRYQITIGISGFGTKNAHVIPINEFDHEDWECPRCHQCMADTILYKNKKVVCEQCGLEVWRENNGKTKPMALY